MSEELQFHSTKRPGIIVLIGGLATTFLAFFLVSLLTSADFNAMGFYINGIIPLGAILVGVLAGSGYGFVSWKTGAKIGGGLLLSVLLLQICNYFVVQYLEFSAVRDALPRNVKITFWEYFDAKTRAFAWVKNGKLGAAFGIWGYGMRLLEIAGFALGGLIVPAVLGSLPYCDECRVYKKTQRWARLPAGVEIRRIKKKDLEGQAEYEREQEAALEQANKRAAELVDRIEVGDAKGFAAQLHETAIASTDAITLTHHLTVDVQVCPRCSAGEVLIKLKSGVQEAAPPVDLAMIDANAEFIETVEALREDLKQMEERKE